MNCDNFNAKKKNSLPRVVTSCLGVKDNSQYWVKTGLWNKTAIFFFLNSSEWYRCFEIALCFFFFSLVICNLPFPGEWGLQYLGCWESQDNRSIRRCSAEIPEILSQTPSVWYGTSADEHCWAQAQPCCPARTLPWKCSSLGIPLTRNSFVHSCCAMLGPGSPLQKLRVWKGQCGDSWSIFLGQQNQSQSSLAQFIPFPARYPTSWSYPFPAGVGSKRPYVHYTVFHWWKLILLLEPGMGVFSVSMPLSAAWDTACPSVIGITQPELCTSHSHLILARFALLGICGFSIGELRAVAHWMGEVSLHSVET